MHRFRLTGTAKLLPLNSFLLLLLLLLLVFLSFLGEALSDKAILLLFKDSVSDPSGILSNWESRNISGDSEHCSWYGVVCDPQFRVSSLKIVGGGRGGNYIAEKACFNLSEFPFYGFGIRRNCPVRYGKLTGKLSPVIAKLTKLRVLSLPFHEFSGEIPSEIWDLENLEVLDLEGNLISGELPVSFRGLRRLRVLNLGLNRIGGQIPDSLSQLVGLEVLNLAGNGLDGSIPPFIGDYPKLWGLYLSLNGLKGEIPDVWANYCGNLRYLDLSRNELNGRIPPSLGNCGKLRVLLLFSNALEGVIPRELGQLRKLQVLDVSRNRLGGYVSEELGNCRDLSVLVLSNLDDPLSGNGKSTGSLDHGKRNVFRGTIPMEIISLPKLRIIWAPKAGFKGEIRSNWGSCDRLETINSPENSLQLNGASYAYISLFFSRACSGTSRNVRRLANARLTTEVIASPDQPGPSSSAQSSEADLQADAVSPSGVASGYRNNKFNSIEIASIVSASVIVLVLLALVILFIYTRKCAPRDGSKVQVFERREIKVFSDIGVPLTFQKVFKATDCFTAGKKIGSGGFGTTYKAEVSPGIIVAVKRLAVGRLHGIQQFHAEIKTLGRIRHPNLVTLIGYHASEMEMFLIYNYLPGGNLEKFIQERTIKAIKWKVIHKIALDVAHAIAYLHDECNPRVIHRDVKPSNILLDNDFNAYLSDFGLSRLLENSETHATTGVAGSFGYLAPEYAMTCRVSEKADVYSYGVVLLELISDKKTCDPSFSTHENGFNIVTWAHMLLRQGRAKEVFAAGIWESGPHDDLVDVLHLAVKCTVDSLSIRPTMKQVVQQLKQIRPHS